MKKKWGKREEILPWRAVRLVKLLEKSMVVEVFILEIVIWLSSTKKWEYGKGENWNDEEGVYMLLKGGTRFFLEIVSIVT